MCGPMIAGRRTSAMVVDAENSRKRMKMLFFMWSVLYNENKQFNLPFFRQSAIEKMKPVNQERMSLRLKTKMEANRNPIICKNNTPADKSTAGRFSKKQYPC